MDKIEDDVMGLTERLSLSTMCGSLVPGRWTPALPLGSFLAEWGGREGGREGEEEKERRERGRGRDT